VAVCAGVLYGVGVALASLSADRLPVLYVTYGLIAGAGVGLGYIVPIATLVKWFPDRRGLITGHAVSGVAVGSLIAAPIAAELIESIGVQDALRVMGAVYLVGSWAPRSSCETRRPGTGRRDGHRLPTAGTLGSASSTSAERFARGSGTCSGRSSSSTSPRASASSPRALRWRETWSASGPWRPAGSWGPGS
jgi:MFS family permease